MINKGLFNDVEVPNVLSKQEKLQYGQFASAGDAYYQNLLVVHNIRLVFRIINKYFLRSNVEYSELLSVGMMGLIKASRKFDYQKNPAFATLAGKAIYNEILSYFKRNKRFLLNKSLDEIIYKKNSYKGEKTYLDIIENDRVAYAEEEALATLEFQEILKIINSLDEIEKTVIVLRFGLSGLPPMTQNEIAKILNCYQGGIHKIEKRAIKRIQQILAIENETEHVDMSKDVSIARR